MLCQLPGGKLSDAGLYSLKGSCVYLQTKHLHVILSLAFAYSMLSSQPCLFTADCTNQKEYKCQKFNGTLKAWVCLKHSLVFINKSHIIAPHPLCLYCKWRWRLNNGCYLYMVCLLKLEGKSWLSFPNKNSFCNRFSDLFECLCSTILNFVLLSHFFFFFYNLRFYSPSSYKELAASHCLKSLIDNSISCLSHFTCLLLSFNSLLSRSIYNPDHAFYTLFNAISALAMLY